jgi:hypothetical protein
MYGASYVASPPQFSNPPRTMRLTAFVALLLLALHVPVLTAQSSFTPGAETNGQINVQVNGTLDDGSGDYHPLSGLVLTLYRGATDSMLLRMDDAGILKLAIARGTYRLSSPEPYEWKGRLFRWNIPLDVQRGMRIVNLTAQNAVVTAATTARSRVSLPEQRTPDNGSGDRWASSTKGFLVGFHLNGSSIELEDFSDETYVGGGAGLQLGYGFTRQLALVSDLTVAIVETDEETIGLGHLDLALRYAFASPTRRVVPFLEGGISVIAAVNDDAEFEDGTTGEASLTGKGFVVGGGVQYYPSPKWAIGAGLKWLVGGEFDEVTVDNVSIGDLNLDVSAARVNIGITWYPAARR